MKLLNKTATLLITLAFLVSSIPLSARGAGGGGGGGGSSIGRGIASAARGFGEQNASRNAESGGSNSSSSERGGSDSNTDVNGPGSSEDGFDGQAYCASRYVPALRPHMVIGGLLLIAIIVVVLQNTEHHKHK